MTAAGLALLLAFTATAGLPGGPALSDVDEPGGFRVEAPKIASRIAVASQVARAPRLERAAVPAPDPSPAAAPAAPAAPQLVALAPEEARPKVVPWVVFGASVVLAAAGTVFAVRTADDIAAMPSMVPDAGGALPSAGEIEGAQSRLFKDAIAANLLLAGAAAGLVTSSVALMSD